MHQDIAARGLGRHGALGLPYLDQAPGGAGQDCAGRAIDADISAARSGTHWPSGLMHHNFSAPGFQIYRRACVLHANLTSAGRTSQRPAYGADPNVAAAGPKFSAAPNAIHGDLAAA